MNKVYLLLRENRESGPYTIDELIQQQLKHTDLIWTEGKSVAWCYPYEMDELKAHVAPKPRLQVVQNPNPSMDAIRADVQRRGEVFSTPSVAASYQHDEIESKADQIRTNVISYAQQNTMPYLRSQYSEPSSGAVFTHQEGFQFVQHTRKKYVTLPQLIATGLITILLASAWYGDWSTIRVKPNVITVASAPAAFNEEKPKLPVQASAVALIDSQLVARSVADSSADFVAATSLKQNRRNNIAVADTNAVDVPSNAETQTTQSTTLTSTADNTAETEVKNLDPVPLEIKEPKKPEIKEPRKDTPQVKPPVEMAKPAVVEEEEKEKKKLGQVIKGIFKKKNKDDE